MPERRALLVGINYLQSASGRLNGCINDVQNMARMLSTIGYATDVLRDDDAANMPTAREIVRRLRRLVAWANASAGRQILFHYSGHGTQTVDTSGDEVDGKDECLVACDHYIIRDDTLHAILGESRAEAQVMVVIDACHSGSMLDLDYQFRAPSASTTPRSLPARITMLSGCQDAQTSADAFGVGAAREWSGAMTSTLLQCLGGSSQTAAELMAAMRRRLHAGGYTQVPQLSCSREIGDADKLSLLQRHRSV